MCIRDRNYNYRYLLVESTGSRLPEHMEVIIPGCELPMCCTSAGFKPGLYMIENWQQLLMADVNEQLLRLAKTHKKELVQS